MKYDVDLSNRTEYLCAFLAMHSDLTGACLHGKGEDSIILEITYNIGAYHKK